MRCELHKFVHFNEFVFKSFDFFSLSWRIDRCLGFCCGSSLDFALLLIGFWKNKCWVGCRAEWQRMAAKGSQCLQFSVSIASERTVRKKNYSLQFPWRCREERFPILVSSSLQPRKNSAYHWSLAQKLSCFPQNHEGSYHYIFFVLAFIMVSLCWILQQKLGFSCFLSLWLFSC